MAHFPPHTHTHSLTHSIHLVGTQKLNVSTSIGTIMIRSGALAPRRSSSPTSRYLTFTYPSSEIVATGGTVGSVTLCVCEFVRRSVTSVQRHSLLSPPVAESHRTRARSQMPHFLLCHRTRCPLHCSTQARHTSHAAHMPLAHRRLTARDWALMTTHTPRITRTRHSLYAHSTRAYRYLPRRPPHVVGHAHPTDMGLRPTLELLCR